MILSAPLIIRKKKKDPRPINSVIGYSLKTIEQKIEANELSVFIQNE